MPQTCACATFRQSVANLMFHKVSFNFATAISKFDTFSSYHIVRTWIAKVTNFLPFCTIGISMYQTCISLYLLFPLLSHPKLLPLWSITDRRMDGRTDGRTTFFTPCYLSSFFSTERAGPYPQAHSTWAGRTMGWMADWTRGLEDSFSFFSHTKQDSLTS